MQIRSLAYRTDVALLQAGGSRVTAGDDCIVVRTPGNPTFWWGNFILIPQIPRSRGELERRIETFRAEFPTAEHLAIGVDGVAADEAAIAGLLPEVGCEVDHSPVLSASPLPPGLPPPGVVIRPLSSDDDWAAQAAMTTYSDLPETEASRAHARARLATQRAMVARGVGTWLGAFLDGGLRASLGIFGSGNGLARYQDVLTHPDWRRRGLAGALIGAASSFALTELRARTLIIVADDGSDACRLYQALGFVVREQQTSLTRPSVDR